MFGFLNSMRPQGADPLANTGVLEAFWRTLPRDDAVVAQRAVCAALVDPVPRTGINGDRLRALLLLDRYAQPLIDTLLADLIAPSTNPPVGQRSWQAAFELCRLLGHALGRFVRAAGDGRGVRGWSDHLPFLLVRILERRRVELLLRPYVDERGTRFAWKDLHELYRVAESSNLLRHAVATRRFLPKGDTTIELEYIHILLHDVLQGGNFAPDDAFWLDATMPHWAHSLVLAAPRDRKAEHRFVVDLDSDLGLARVDRDSLKDCLALDPGPMLRSIRDEVAALRGAPASPDRTSMRPARQQKIFSRVEGLFATVRPVIHRRGERQPVALRVEVVVGVAQIARALRLKSDAHLPAAALSVRPSGSAFDPISDGGTIGGATLSMRTIEGRTVDASPMSQSNGVVRSQLTMVDRSDSGCRLHGAASAETPLLPGVLFAFRMDPASPWTLAVVRSVKKRLAGKRVEIGAEYLGTNPRRVVAVVPDSESTPPRPPGVEPPRFAAIVLPESAGPPVVPFRTLVLPSRGIAPADRLSVRSHTDRCTIQLGEPLEEQAGFVWSPFEILERWSREEATESRSGTG